MQDEVQYTLSGTKDHINEDTRPKARPAAASVGRTMDLRFNRLFLIKKMENTVINDLRLLHG